jgi:glycerol uptake facilitator-like aquaporin
VAAFTVLTVFPDHQNDPPSATDQPAPQGFVPIAIGVALTLILHRDSVTNLSVNLARITGPPMLVGGSAIDQLWLFWMASIIGAAPESRRAVVVSA